MNLGAYLERVRLRDWKLQEIGFIVLGLRDVPDKLRSLHRDEHVAKVCEDMEFALDRLEELTS